MKGLLMKVDQIVHGDAVVSLKTLPADSVDLVYFDPPFFSQKNHTLSNKGAEKVFSFDDCWDSLVSYLDLIRNVLEESKRVLRDTGSVFLHCDRTASHHIRRLMDEVFRSENFQSEIIWTYKRWSNSKKGLLNAHQSIYFYSKTSDFKFHRTFTSYSSTTNVDQILQARERDKNGKAIYKRDASGKIVLGKEKKGVPLSDVWEIPYLNPKAKERVGYPTQKPVNLLKQIIELSTDEGDLVVDPFCGSGTTCVAAKSVGRSFVGIDVSEDAVRLSRQRLEEMIISESRLLEAGKESYLEKDEKQSAILESINAIPVQRNQGIDGFLKEHVQGTPVPVKIQREDESLVDCFERLSRASRGKGYALKLVVQTNPGEAMFPPDDIIVMKTLDLQIEESKISGVSPRSLTF